MIPTSTATGMAFKTPLIDTTNIISPSAATNDESLPIPPDV